MSCRVRDPWEVPRSLPRVLPVARSGAQHATPRRPTGTRSRGTVSIRPGLTRPGSTGRRDQALGLRYGSAGAAHALGEYKAHVSDVATQARIAVVNNVFSALAFSPDGRSLAASRAMSLSLSDPRTGQKLR